jgi:hypothetical protein
MFLVVLHSQVPIIPLSIFLSPGRTGVLNPGTFAQIPPHFGQYCVTAHRRRNEFSNLLFNHFDVKAGPGWHVAPPPSNSPAL